MATSDRLPADLLLAWGEPLWLPRNRGHHDFCAAEVSPEEKTGQNPAKTPQKAVFAGFFVPEELDEAQVRLLENIQRVFPQLGQRQALDDPTPLLEVDGGQAVVFGEADWLADADELPVRLCVVPALGQMLEDPLAKKHTYLALLKFFAEA